MGIFFMVLQPDDTKPPFAVTGFAVSCDTLDELHAALLEDDVILFDVVRWDDRNGQRHIVSTNRQIFSRRAIRQVKDYAGPAFVRGAA